MRRVPSLRAIALVLAAALALHQLRYLITGPPDHAAFPSEHGYLPLACAATSLALVAAAVMFARALLRARRTAGAGSAPSGFVRVWALATGALLGLHLGQELVESALSGSAHGPLALLADGGLLAPALAAALGALVALGLGSAERALAQAARAGRHRRRTGCPASEPLRPAFLARPPAPPLARHLAGRAPPPAA